MDQPDTQPAPFVAHRADNLSAMKLPARIITYAWGDSYLDDLLCFTIPALLAPGNLPFVASHVPCEFVLLTEERFFDKVSSHPAIRALSKHCSFRLIGLDDLISSRGESYGMALTYVLHRGFVDLGSAMTDSWQMFLNADFILADGCLRNLMAHLSRGERIVAAPSYCAVAGSVKPELMKSFNEKDWTLSIQPRELAKLVLQHAHPSIRHQTLDQGENHLSPMYQFYWKVDNDTLLGYQLPIAIVGMRPERFIAEPHSYWDHGLMQEYCPNAEVKVIGDSDEFMMLELRDDKIDEGWVKSGRPEPEKVGNAMMSWLTSYQRRFAKSPLTLHAADLPVGMEGARRKLTAFVNDVLTHVPDFLPSHRGHPQWIYHRSNFARKRHEFLSERLGMLTAKMPPPDWLLEIDKPWWALDSLRKQKAGRKAQLDLELGILENAPDAINAATESLLSDAARRLIGNSSSLPDSSDDPLQDYLYKMSKHSGDIRETHAAASMKHELLLNDASIDFVDAYAKECVAILESRRRLHQELPHRRALLERRLTELDHEFAALLRESEDQYELAFRRIKSAAVPLTRRRVGLGTMTGTVQRLYRDRPQPDKTNPYWQTLGHLRSIIEQAVKNGARHALFVGEHAGICDEIIDLVGEFISVSLEGLKTGNLAITFEERPEFDLCICDLEYDNLHTFSEIFALARPLMRAGGTILGVHVAANAAMHIDQAALIKDLQNLPEYRVYYAGSSGSHEAPGGFEAPGNFDGCGSLTIAAKLPDDGTLQYSLSTGIYVRAMEAPANKSHIVSSTGVMELTPTTLLIVGDSNMANCGDGHYVPKGPVHAFNVFDMMYCRAIDPLPGASDAGASIWGKVGDKLVHAGFRSVLFVPIACSGSNVRDWAPGGRCFARLMFALHRVKMAQIKIDLLCWQHSGVDSNRGRTNAAEYESSFLNMLAAIYDSGVRVPTFVAVSTMNSKNAESNTDDICSAQMRLVIEHPNIVLPGPNLMQIAPEHRNNGRRYSQSGVDLAAQAWYEAINSGPNTWNAVRAKYRDELQGTKDVFVTPGNAESAQ